MKKDLLGPKSDKNMIRIEIGMKIRQTEVGRAGTNPHVLPHATISPRAPGEGLLASTTPARSLHSHSPGAPIRVGELAGGFARVGCSWLGFEGDTCCRLTGAT